MAGRLSRLDHVYRSLLLTKFYTRGWGNPCHLEQIIKLRKAVGTRETNADLLSTPTSVIQITKQETRDEAIILTGQFQSPILNHLDPAILPPETHTCHFEAVLPRPAVLSSGAEKPLVLQFAGTGDHYFWRRRKLMALPMLKERGIASVLVENPYYGLRKPRKQLRSSLFFVSDLFIMGAALIFESQVLLRWAGEEGFGPLVCHGVSMGGHMACLSASASPRPVGLAPCLAATSASVTFCQGVMSRAINWRQLEQQLRDCPDYKKLVWPLVRSPERYQPPAQLTADFFMRCLMDECTHVGNYSPPLDTDIVEIVRAEYDAYQPGEGITPLEHYYPGALSTNINEGHVRSYLFYQHVFRQAIYRVVDKMIYKHKDKHKSSISVT